MLRRYGCAAAGLAALVLGASGTPVRAHDFLLLLGGDFNTRGNVYGYGGLITPLPLLGNTGSLGQDGFLLRLWGFGQRFDYTRLNQPEVDVSGGGVEVGLGYQVVRPGWRVAGYASYAYRSLELSPNDPRSELRRDHGLRLQLEGAMDFTPQLGVEVMGSYVINWNNYWARVRPYYRLWDDFRVGPEFTFLGGNEHDRQRYGGHFAGLKLGPANIAFSAGGDYDSRKETWGAYFNVGVSFLFKTN